MSSDVCVDTFEQRASKSATGGVGQSGLTTIDACKDECRDNAATCVGFDWTKSGTGVVCWLFTELTAFNGNSDNTGVDQYLRIPCLGKHFSHLDSFIKIFLFF